MQHQPWSLPHSCSGMLTRRCNMFQLQHTEQAAHQADLPCPDQWPQEGQVMVEPASTDHQTLCATHAGLYLYGHRIMQVSASSTRRLAMQSEPYPCNLHLR